MLIFKQRRPFVDITQSNDITDDWSPTLAAADCGQQLRQTAGVVVFTAETKSLQQTYKQAIYNSNYAADFVVIISIVIVSC